MANNYTNINKTNNLFSPNIKKKTTTYWDRHKYVAVNAPLDNLQRQYR